MAEYSPKRNSGLFKSFLYFVLIFVILASYFALSRNPLEKPQEISLSEVAGKIKAGEVKQIVIEGEQKLNITLQDETNVRSLKEVGESLPTVLSTYGVTSEQMSQTNISVQNDRGISFWLGSALPLILPIIFFAVFIWLIFRQVQGTNNRAMMFGQSRPGVVDTNDKKKAITFKDVAGAAEAKEELKEIVEFLKTPKKFTNLGAQIPKGVLLMGPPGTGKTLLGRAVAGEAQVPFLHISGSEFVEMFVGVGASRVRDLFRKAKKVAPAIVFVDEIDAVGRQRGSGLGGSHDEREQTLNQILVEMDGFEQDTNVIVMAATNRPDVLDPALLRPGRFDRQVVMDMPDMSDRFEILKVHAQKKVMEKDINLKLVAERTPGFSGADLANLLNEAAILAARRNKKTVGLNECLESIEKVILGPERRTQLVSDHEKKITAFHEAGHALVAHMLPHADPVRKVSVISRGRAAGYTLKLPTEDKRMHSRGEFVDDLSVMLAGHAAEMLVMGDITSGASNDLEKATKLARSMVTSFGMSDKLGPRTFGQRQEMIFLGREITEERDYSDHTAREIDAEVNRFIQDAYTVTNKILHVYKENLDAIANTLIKQETLDQEEFAKVVGVAKGLFGQA